MSVGKFRTGVILIALGVVLLLHTTDVIDFGFWQTLFKLWPILLIAIGLEKIFSATANLKPLAYISPILIVAVVIWAAVAGERGGYWIIDDDDPDRSGSSDIYTWTEEGSSSTERLDIKLKKAGGRIVVRDGAATGSLLEGRLRYWGSRPTVDSDETASTLEVQIKDRSSIASKRDTWILKIADRVPVTMEVDGGGARMRLDYTGIRLEELTLDAGAVDIDLTFGSLSPLVKCVIECAAATLDITIPAGAGVSIERETALSHFSASGLSLVERGTAMESPDFDAQPVKINLRIDSGLSSLRIRRAGDVDFDPST
ncbi:MAG TPA: DUF5668 domain-containing protein [Acidobacteriota bacterium]|nr:DUF5668 domain-containing protein [Acidobacteriota bacterium]